MGRPSNLSASHPIETTVELDKTRRQFPRKKLTASFLLSLALSLAAAPAVAARQPNPAAKDRNDARAFIAAAKKAHKSGAAVVATLPNLMHSNSSTCGGAVGRAIGDPSVNTTTLEALQVDAYEVLLLRVLVPTVKRYSRDLRAVHARDSVLRRYTTYVAATMTPDVERYASVPSFDVCELFRQWEAIGFKAGFDWIAAAGVPKNLADHVESDFSKLGTPATLYNLIGHRLVAFGVPSTAAFWFPNALLHAAGQ